MRRPAACQTCLRNARDAARVAPAPAGCRLRHLVRAHAGPGPTRRVDTLALAHLGGSGLIVGAAVGILLGYGTAVVVTWGLVVALMWAGLALAGAACE